MLTEPKTYYDVKCNQPYILTADTKHLRDFVVPAGTAVYKSEEYDYGLANDDTRATGEEYVSMTTEPSGRMKDGAEYPFGCFSFTVPIRILRTKPEMTSAIANATGGALSPAPETINRQPVAALLNEVDCRIEHGADSKGHLEFVRDQLREILDGGAS